MSNRVVHFEIPANQPQDLTRFYGDLFGWQFTKLPSPGPEYWLCTTGQEGPGINGAIMQRQHPQQPMVNYVSVQDIDQTLEKATQLGGKSALPKTPVPGTGYFAAFVDPQGTIMGLWQDDAGAK